MLTKYKSKQAPLGHFSFTKIIEKKKAEWNCELCSIFSAKIKVFVAFVLWKFVIFPFNWPTLFIHLISLFIKCLLFGGKIVPIVYFVNCL